MIGARRLIRDTSRISVVNEGWLNSCVHCVQMSLYDVHSIRVTLMSTDYCISFMLAETLLQSVAVAFPSS